MYFSKLCQEILDNDQLDTHLLYFILQYVYYNPLICFEHYMLLIKKLNCIDATSGIVTLGKWPSGAPDLTYYNVYFGNVNVL